MYGNAIRYIDVSYIIAKMGCYWLTCWCGMIWLATDEIMILRNVNVWANIDSKKCDYAGGIHVGVVSAQLIMIHIITYVKEVYEEDLHALQLSPMAAASAPEPVPPHSPYVPVYGIVLLEYCEKLSMRLLFFCSSDIFAYLLHLAPRFYNLWLG